MLCYTHTDVWLIKTMDWLAMANSVHLHGYAEERTIICCKWY